MRTNEEESRWQRLKNWLVATAGETVTVVLLLLFAWASCLVIFNYFSETDFSDEATNETADAPSATDKEPERGECNVWGLELHGEVVDFIDQNVDPEAFVQNTQTSADNLTAGLDQAAADDSVKAVLLEVDSYGGNAVAGEEISRALRRLGKPSVALVRGAGASAAYLAASGADHIVASRYSDVGGIGVTMSYIDNVAQNQQEGLSYVSLSSGKFKDTGDPNKTLTEEEKNLLMRDINIMHRNFIRDVADNRHLDLAKVAAMADGSTMLGEMALSSGLIDKLGGLDEAKAYLKDKIQTDVTLCW